MPTPQELLEIARSQLQSGEQGDPIAGPGGPLAQENVTRLLSIAQTLPNRSRPAPKRDIGIIGSATAGVKTGVLDPLTIVTGPQEADPRIDEPSEKVANFLGSMVGLGISFVPFVAGTGMALRGVGLAAKMSPEVYGFVRNTLAGAAQFAGTSESSEEVPGNIALGVAFGGAIEGFFLARAMRGRAGSIVNESLSNTGNPIPDVAVSIETLAKEVELAPSIAKRPNRMASELQGLKSQDLSYDQMLTNLAAEEVTTVRLEGLAESNSIMSYARGRFPEAQVTSRSYQGGALHEVLIHNPINPEERLTSKQLTQWRTTGIAENQELIYNGKSYAATGGVASEGRIQIKDPNRPGTVFAPLLSDVEKPILPKFFSAARSKTEILESAVRESEVNVGFVVPNANNAEGALRARRGIVNTEGFATAETMNAFRATYRDKLIKINVPSQEEAFAIMMKQEGIKGLVTREAGITTGLHIFDQGSVSFVREVPRPLTRTVTKEVPVPRPGRRPPLMGAEDSMATQSVLASIDKQIAATTDTNVIAALREKRRSIVEVSMDINYPPVMQKITEDIPVVGLTLDNAVTSVDLATGNLVIQSIVPSWRNAITSSLRAKGIPEKEIASFLSLREAQLGRTLDNLMDPEFQNLKKASEFQYGGGCV